MSALLGVPVDAAYHVVSLLARLLTPALGGLAAAAAIVMFTMVIRLLVLPLSFRATRGLEAQARIAPQAQALRQKYARHPDRMQRELAALYRAEGTSMFAGFGPLLLQWPLLSVMYLLFRSPAVGGQHNVLLSHNLFAAALGSHWLGGPGPLSAQGAVFAILFTLLAAASLLTARLARRRPAASPAGTSRAGTSRAGTSRAGTSRAGTSRASATPAGTSHADASPAPAPGPGTAAGVLGWAAPFVTVAVAAFVPLAAGLYLVTTAVWTLGERVFLLRRSSRT